MTPAKTIRFRDGTVVTLAVLECMWAIEARGGTVVLADAWSPDSGDDGSVQIEPPACATPDDRAFLRAHRAEVRFLVRYRADDRHLRDPPSVRY